MSSSTEIQLLREEMMLEFRKINEILSVISENVRDQKGAVSKMENHINFVESTYEVVRSPLDFAIKRINMLRDVENTLTIPKIK